MEKSISSFLCKKLKSAAKGKKVFLKKFKQYNRADDKKIAYCIFPEHDLEINYYGLLYLDEFLLRNGYDRAMIFTCDETVLSKANDFSKNICEIVFLKEEMTSLVDYYSLLKFVPSVVVVSLDKPAGRRGTNLLGKNGLSVEQMIAIGVYFLIPFEKINSDFRGEN